MRLLIALLPLLLIQPVHAYKQQDVEKVSPPTGETSILRGYNSRTGGLMNVCLEPVAESTVVSESENPDGFQRFEYVNHAQQMMNEQNLAVSAKVKVNYGVGSASASTDLEFYQKNKSSVQEGAMWAYYSDLEAPEYSNPAATYQLTEDAAKMLRKAAKKSGTRRAFEKHCGDSVVIGLQSGRHAEGLLTNRSESKESEKDQQILIEASVSYMGSKGSASVKKDNKEFKKKDFDQLKVEFRTSGDVEIDGITNMTSFRKAFRKFQSQPKEDARTLKYIYLISYEDLLPTKAFDLGLPRWQLRKVNKIVNGISVIESAFLTARNDSRLQKNPTHLRNTKRNLKNEYKVLAQQMRQQKGCLGKWSQTCENLFHRFNNFSSIGNMKRMRQFVRNAKKTKNECNTGYAVSKPGGERLCIVCGVAKEPKFLNSGNGKCAYIAETKAAKGDTRLWAKNLKISDKEFGGGGEYLKSLLTYPDKCKSNGKGCGQPAANKLCADRGFIKATNYEVWAWSPNNSIHYDPFRTEYANSKRCKADSSSFTAVRCRTFKYIDCTGENGSKAKPKKKAKNKKKKKNKGKKNKKSKKLKTA